MTEPERVEPLGLAARAPADPSAAAELSESKATRFELIVAKHFSAMWRFLRRLGLDEPDTDDAAQEVLMIVAAKLDVIGRDSERSYLFSTAFKVAAGARRDRRRHETADPDAVLSLEARGTDPEELLELKRARVLLDRLLSPIPIELRAVFVLYELEGMTMAEIADALKLAPGTVASRLRRGRELFNARFARLKAREPWIRGAR